MKYYLRLLILVLTQGRRSRCSILGPCTSRFRVWPNDLDLFMHMNNGAYLTIADLARTDLLLRADAFTPIRKRGWYPVMAGETIRFRRSLKLFQRYTITTSVIGWNERSVYIEQVFDRPTKEGSERVARALIDARFLSTRGERISTEAVLRAAGYDEGIDIEGAGSALPQWASDWVNSMQLMDNTEPGNTTHDIRAE